jgi:hypothetical protein
LTCVIAGGIVALLVVGLVCVATGQAKGPSWNAGNDRIFTDFNSPQLGWTNDGTSLDVIENGRNASGLAVADSALTHGAPTGANAAGYLEARMSGPVNRVGAVAEFHSANSGSIGLVSSSESIAAANGNGIHDRLPNIGLLFAATSTGWNFGLWDAAAKTQQVLMYGSLALPADGSGQAFEVTRHGDTVTIRLPDGTMHATADPRIADWSGPWVAWELYEQDVGRVPATLTAVWAS